MDLNGASNPTNTRIQPSIRSFFQPKTPQYSAPPSQTPQRSPPLAPKPTFTSPSISTPPPPSEPAKLSSKESKTIPQPSAILPIQQEHIQPLRRINSLLLPIAYPDAFYHALASSTLSRAILWDSKVIGGIAVRLDPSLAPSSTPQNPQFIPGSFDIYIQSLALLSPYRGKGLAAAALESIVKEAVELGSRGEAKEVVRELYAHVWTENGEGLEWYMKRGFRREEGVVPGYYRRLKPDTAWILRRRLSVADHLSANMDTKENVKEGVEENVELGADLPVGLKERPGNMKHTKSFQDRRPDMEWNDLPEDVLRTGLLRPPSEAASTASSRSSSRSGTGKKKRQYPAAAFGS